MKTIRHRTRIDWWIALILLAVGVAMPLSLLVGIPLNWYEPGEAAVLAVTAVFMIALIAAITAWSYSATYYQLGEQGLTVRNYFFHAKTVPYSEILSAKESVNIVNRPKTWTAPLSVVGVRIDYKKDGGSSWFFIAPRNRTLFLSQLQDRIEKCQTMK